MTEKNVFLIQTCLYRELNEKANQLAHTIRKKYKDHWGEDVRGDTLIGIYIERSPEMIIGILGILKAGAAYVPFDSADPEERLKFKINDCRCKVILTSQSTVEDLVFLTKSDTLLFSIDSCWDEIEKVSKSNPVPINKSTDLAYVIYTSGSTGIPKGVMVEHHSAINLICNQICKFNVEKKDRLLQFASFSFDASVSELFVSLNTGSSLYIVGKEIRNNSYELFNYIEKNKLTVATLPPALLKTVEYKKLPNLKTIVVAGESCDEGVMKQWSVGRRFINAYGPTESTVCSCLHVYKTGDLNTNIGTPLASIKQYILDVNLQPVPIGVIGELYIGGAGLTRGYLNHSKLTAEKFIPNLFATEDDKLKGHTRLYKTGDLCRYLPDGNIEYIGRNDFQVKIRGFRIELSEIEAVLTKIPCIKQTVVIAKEKEMESERNKYLVAYYITDQKTKFNQGDLFNILGKTLPEYMIPSTFVELQKFPLTANGKLDRDALPDPEFTNKENYVAPTTDLEKQLVVIWQELLNLKQVGITDDFFRIGGDSILSIQLSSRLRRAELTCSVKDIFAHRTIASLAIFLQQKREKIKMLAEQGDLVGKFALLPIQSWFFEREFENANHWNQSFLIRTPELDLDKLKKVTYSLIEHHDVLRTTFTNKNQSYNKKNKITDIKTADIRHYSKEQIDNLLTEWQSSFDIKKGPLWQIGYLYGYSDGTARIYFALHHLIVDTVSWRILTEDLKNLYLNRSPLGRKKTSYRQWIRRVQQYAEEKSAQAEYWKNIIDSSPVYSSLLLGDEILKIVEIKEKITENLLRKANKAFNTEINDILLTALAMSLEKTTESKANIITLEGHGREPIDDTVDLSKTVGWLTTAFPVKLEPKNNLAESLQYIKENLRNVPDKGLGFGALNYYGKNQIDINDRWKLPPVNFNYLGQFANSDEEWDITAENSGNNISRKNQSTNIISINCFITKGKLIFFIKTKLKESVANNFAKNFKRDLEYIINYCCTRNKTEYTPSDFDDFTPFIKYDNLSANNLFMFPPGDGGAESYMRNLIPKLKKLDLTVFNNFMFHLDNTKGKDILEDVSFNKLASIYKLYIKKVQHKGPYNLFGWSFGGVLAFEVATQMIEEGEKIENLIILDSYFNYKKAVETAIKFSELLNISRKNINYKYQPAFKNFNNKFITLIKSAKTNEKKQTKAYSKNSEEEQTYDILQKYYVTQTTDNQLSDVVNTDAFSTVNVNIGHSDWLYSSHYTNFISEIILTKLKPNH